MDPGTLPVAPPDDDAGARRLPFGASAFLAAVVTALPVLFFDQAEGLVAEVFGLDGGSIVMVVIVLGFAFGWVLATIVLAAWSPFPEREGLRAGLGIACLMALVVAGIAVLLGDLEVLAYVLPLFGSLALGLGAVAGMVAQWWQGGSPGSGRNAVVSLACGAALLVATTLLFPVAVEPSRPEGLAAWAFILLFLGAGALGLWSRRPATPRPDAD